MDFSYKFPAVKGIQASKEYYIAMIPLKLLSRLFIDEEDYVPPEYRAQRRLNISRIPVISDYILSNRASYVFSALAASVDGEYQFSPIGIAEDIGILEISMDAHLMIVDGQHRKASIIQAISEDSTLNNETIPIVLYEDRGLERSQQMFTDLNKHAVKTSNSISELYDSRDDLAVATRKIITAVPFFNEYTDKEKDNLGKYSSNLFTLNVFYKANRRILHGSSIEKRDEDFLIKFWTGVAENIVPWLELQNHGISKSELRENYIVTQAVAIQAFGRVGACFFSEKKKLQAQTMSRLREIDWTRANPKWHLRTIQANGRMITNEAAIILTANIIKIAIGLPLNQDEQNRENEFKNRHEIEVEG